MDETTAIEHASVAADAWLELRDAGDVEGMYRESSALFRRMVTEEQWRDAFGKVDVTFGPSRQRFLRDTEYRESIPGGPDGHYVVLHYDTEFERKQEAIETVVTMLDDDDRWRVGGYFIQ